MPSATAAIMPAIKGVLIGGTATMIIVTLFLTQLGAGIAAILMLLGVAFASAYFALGSQHAR